MFITRIIHDASNPWIPFFSEKGAFWAEKGLRMWIFSRKAVPEILDEIVKEANKNGFFTKKMLESALRWKKGNYNSWIKNAPPLNWDEEKAEEAFNAIIKLLLNYGKANGMNNIGFITSSRCIVNMIIQSRGLGDGYLFPFKGCNHQAYYKGLFGSVFNLPDILAYTEYEILADAKQYYDTIMSMEKNRKSKQLELYNYLQLNTWENDIQRCCAKRHLNRLKRTRFIQRITEIESKHF